MDRFDILNPLINWIDFKCAIHGVENEYLEDAKRKFYKQNKCEEEITQFMNWLDRSRNQGTLPYEKIEVYPGKVVKIMIWDIEYWHEYGKMKKRKIYLAKQGELSAPETLIRSEKPDRKKQAAGEREPGDEQ